ncbi:MAG TPA: DUF3048 domain-containing protein [Sporosarcina sp.]|nr:DUF3048 domain-containing protein [Sporosarcina sp.]
MKGRMGKWLIVAMLLLLIMSACSKKKIVDGIPLPVPTDKVEAGTHDDDEEPVELKYRAPFTGLALEKENTLRPVLVTINNHPQARPQSGIAEADVVYEFMAEGTVTRFLALYQTNLPDEIGPVRSARDYFVDLAKGLDAFYIAHGFSPEAKKMLDAQVVDNINGMYYDGTLFWRSKDRKAPHNSYISRENILKGADKIGAPMEISKMPPFSFHESVEGAKLGNIASTVTVRFGSDSKFHNTYTYDEEKGTYDRSAGGVKTVDKVTGNPVEVSNVLVFETTYNTIDSVGRQEVDLTSGGRALLFNGGIVKELEWKAIDGFLVPIENGIPAKLVPGMTWISIVSTKPGIDSSVVHTP